MKNLNSYIEFTQIKPGLNSKETNELIKIAIETKCRAMVLNYQDLGLLAKLKKDLNSDIKSVVICNFPWHSPTLIFTLAELTNDWEELDILIPIIFYKLYKDHDKFLDEYFKHIKKQIGETKPIKLIVETVLIRETYKEYWKEKLVELANYCRKNNMIIKTNTGLYNAKHTFYDLCEEVKIIKQVVPKVVIKAAGGIKTLEQAKKLIELGVSYIGTSSLEIVKGEL